MLRHVDTEFVMLDLMTNMFNRRSSAMKALLVQALSILYIVFYW